MSGFVEEMKNKVINGGKITKEEAKKLYSCDLDELTEASNRIEISSVEMYLIFVP